MNFRLALKTAFRTRIPPVLTDEDVDALLAHKEDAALIDNLWMISTFSEEAKMKFLKFFATHKRVSEAGNK